MLNPPDAPRQYIAAHPGVHKGVTVQPWQRQLVDFRPVRCELFLQGVGVQRIDAPFIVGNVAETAGSLGHVSNRI